MFETFILKVKGVYKSTVMWFNGLILTAMPFVDNIMQAIRDNLPAVSQWLTADILKGAAVFILLANIALRFRTKTDLADK
jgi:hypothetical protein